MITLLTILHVVVCVFLIAIVLLQQGKGADMGAAFGGSGQTVFGTDGPLPLLNKITTGAAIVFMMTSVTLAYNSAHSTSGSVMKNAVVPAPISQETQIIPAPVEVPLSRSADKSETPASAEFPGTEVNKAPASFPGEAAPTTETETKN